MDEQGLPWDDLRTVMAIARAGSLSGAGRALGVSHATIFRRLGAIEARLGVSLFERSRDGYVPTPAGEDIAATAERIEAEVLGAERRVAGRDLRPSGTVRVTTTDSLLAGLLTPIFAAFRAIHPEIALDVAISNHPFDLTRRETDVAIRSSMSPPETLVGRKLGTLAQCVYTSTHGGAAADWVGWDESMLHSQFARWLKARGHDTRSGYRVNSVMGLCEAVRSGLGETVLPCYLADGDTGLMRRGEPIPELAIDLWLLIHPDLRRVARIRAFADFVSEAVRDVRDRLLGVGGAWPRPRRGEG
ncbi:LysR family transcriptional regulator [Pelagibacterium xiamenense]|uniref:LysR family transcriptional regulator n=1 Tax=Pelagibacterium xiamenense TaxID=2901140 RepID=UPI001E5FFD8A|nr:LysR family transcriptional regulator [Pelagibacterium xiamenense]MCD7061320.1 LysR family transcriptional regulator [Pelagibacterium xiamenense]